MTTLFGFDAGMGALKLYGPHGGLEFVSQVAISRSRKMGRMLGLRAAKPPMRVITRNGRFYVGKEAHDFGRAVENLDYDRLTGSPEIHALLYGAISTYRQHYQAAFDDVAFIVGLPLEPLTGEDAQTNVNAVKRWLGGEHSWEIEQGNETQSCQLNVTEVKVTSQPVGALFDYLLDEEGRFVSSRKPAFKGEVGVISIGFNTLELLVVKNRRPVEDLSTGNTVGVRRLLELVDDNEGLYSLGQLDAMLREGNLDVRQALPVWEREIWGQVERTWGRTWRRFHAVLIVGGGAVLLKNSLPLRFNGKGFVPDQPVMSIARGLYKLAVQQARRKQQRQARKESN